MPDLDESKKRLDAALQRLETLINAVSVSGDSGSADEAAKALVSENAELRAQLSDIQADNATLKQSVEDMSKQVATVLTKLDQVLEAGDAAA